MSKLWLKDNHTIYVNAQGQPYYTDICCCLSSKTCWQRYTASCVSVAGRQASWTTPVFDIGECREEPDPAWGNTGIWVMDNPGAAHIWLQGSRCYGAESCDEPTPGTVVPPVSYPCSCQSISISNQVSIPNNQYWVRYWDVYGWAASASSPHVTSHIPMWDISNVMSVSDVVRLTGGPTSDYRSGYRYIANYSSAWQRTKPQSFCPETGAAYAAWSASRHNQEYYSYVHGYSTVIGADAYTFIATPRDDLYIPEYRNSPYFIQSSTVYSVYTTKDGVQSLGYEAIGQVTDQDLVYSSVCTVLKAPGNITFGYNQWGDLHVVQRHANKDPVQYRCTREATGGACSPQYRYVSDCGSYNGSYQGCPLWQYNPYVVTDYDLTQMNLQQWEYATGELDDRPSSQYTIVAAKEMFCPEYRYMFITEAWGTCPTDPALGCPFGYNYPTVRGNFRMRTSWASHTVGMPEYLPQPYFSAGLYDPVQDNVTYWLHEVDESLDANDNPVANPALRIVSPTKDGHAYRAYRLDIFNFPTWRINRKTSNYIDGSSPEVPAVDFSDTAYKCAEMCAETPGWWSSDCWWPETNRAKSSEPSNACYLTQGNVINGIYDINPGVDRSSLGGLTALTMLSSVYTSVTGGVSRCYVRTASLYNATGGIPHYKYYYGVCAEQITSRLDFDQSMIYITTRCLCQLDERTSDRQPAHGNLTWQGHVADPRWCGSAISDIAMPFCEGYSSSSSIMSYRKRAACVVQYATLCCDSLAVDTTNTVLTSAQIASKMLEMFGCHEGSESSSMPDPTHPELLIKYDTWSTFVRFRALPVIYHGKKSYYATYQGSDYQLNWMETSWALQSGALSPSASFNTDDDTQIFPKDGTYITRPRGTTIEIRYP